MTIEKIIQKGSIILKNYNICSHELDAQLILSDIMKIRREFLITNGKEKAISEKVINAIIFITTIPN